MRCHNAIRLIGSADDGRVGLQMLDALMTHLEQCAPCRQEAETQIVVKRVLASRPDEAIPLTLARRLACELNSVASQPVRPFVAWFEYFIARVRAKS
jgi:hypothetical protein